MFTKLLMNSGCDNFAQDKRFSPANIYYLFFFSCLQTSRSVGKQKRQQVANGVLGKANHFW